MNPAARNPSGTRTKGQGIGKTDIITAPIAAINPIRTANRLWKLISVENCTIGGWGALGGGSATTATASGYSRPG